MGLKNMSARASLKNIGTVISKLMLKVQHVNAHSNR